MPLLRCPHCRAKLNVPDDIHARKLRCRGCDNSFTLDSVKGSASEANPGVVDTEFLQSAGRRDSQLAGASGTRPVASWVNRTGKALCECVSPNRAGVRLGLAIACFTAALLCIGLPPSPWFLLPYLLITAGSIALLSFAAVRFVLPSRREIVTRFIFVTAALWTYGVNDFYVKHMETPNDQGGVTTYRDWYTRWGNEHYYRSLIVENADGDWLLSGEGPMTASGKTHGKWRVTYFDPEAPILGTESECNWYWYGEEITEGEWHLRNGD